MNQKPDYKNWIPNGMLFGVIAAAIVCAILFVLFGVLGLGCNSTLRLVLGIVLGILLFVLVAFSILCLMWHSAFSYNGKRQMSRQIIEGVAEHVNVKEGGICLDIGCGSGALTIEVAKRNPKAKIIGLDRWGKDYASFSKPLCESNASIEGVSNNTEFVKGDATSLSYPDGYFDAITSNYCIHNIPSKNRQKILLEALRTLKKGGTFAMHDIFSKAKYGDMQKFIQELKDAGYEKVDLIDTTNGMFMSHKESILLELSGSAILCGIK